MRTTTTPNPIPPMATDASAPGAPTAPVSVLLVDDEARNLDALETILASPEYRLVRAQNAEEALHALIQGEFAVIVLDIRMPSMNGLELAQIIKQRKRTQHIPIIFLSAYYQEDEQVLQGYGAGAVDYLAKPCKPAVLRSKVAVFAELFRMTRALQIEIEERKRLEADIARTIEREQMRLGQELHDGLAQQLAGIGFLFAALRTRLRRTSPSCIAEMNKLQALLGHSVEHARGLAKGFYPVELEQHGLLFALQGIALRTEQMFKIQCSVQVHEPCGLDVTGQPAIELFRIAQEAVHNAAKHAAARQVVIETSSSNGHFTLSVKDDGVGLPPNADKGNGMGMRIMEHRARIIGGTLDFRNRPDGGAIISCSIPAANMLPSHGRLTDESPFEIPPPDATRSASLPPHGRLRPLPPAQPPT